MKPYKTPDNGGWDCLLTVFFGIILSNRVYN